MTSPGGPRIKGYADLAALFRRHIRDGHYRPGQRLPAEPDLMAEFGLARETVRRAMRMLRVEGVADYVPGWGTVVREPRAKEDLILKAGWTVEIRMPDPDERDLHDIPEGVPVFWLVDPQGAGDLYPGDRFRLRGAD